LDSEKRDLEKQVYRSVFDFDGGFVLRQKIGIEINSFVDWIKKKQSQPLLDGESSFLNQLKLHCENLILAIQINRNLAFKEESDDLRIQSIIDDINRVYQNDPAGVQRYTVHEVLEISSIFNEYKQKFVIADEVSKLLGFRDKLIVVNQEVDQSIVQELAEVNSKMQMKQEEIDLITLAQEVINTELKRLFTQLGHYFVSTQNTRRHVDRCLADAKAQKICIDCVVRTYDNDKKTHILGDILKLDQAAKRFADCIQRLERMAEFDPSSVRAVLESGAFAVEPQRVPVQVQEIGPVYLDDLTGLIQIFTKFLPKAEAGDDKNAFNWRIYKTKNGTSITKEYPSLGMVGATKNWFGMGEASQSADNLAVQTAIEMLNKIVNIAKGLLAIEALAPAAAQMQECQESGESQLLSIDQLTAHKLQSKDYPLPFKAFLGLRDSFDSSLSELRTVNAAL
jgi:hypothetical protein